MLENASGNLQIRAELPGVRKEDIDVSVVGSNLIIQAEKKDQRREDIGTYHHAERYYGKIRRSVLLPYDVDTSNINASFTNGVLNLEFERSPEVATKKRIEIA